VVEVVKTVFASQLSDCLRKTYRGHIPSIAVIARDFSFKAPHLPHISGETVRKWLRGESLPHVSRMQVLIDWLGPEVATPFEQHTRALTHRANGASVEITDTTDGHGDELLHIARLLTEKEYQSVLDIARLLAEKHRHG
jgi:hypothetical protein